MPEATALAIPPISSIYICIVYVDVKEDFTVQANGTHMVAT